MSVTVTFDGGRRQLATTILCQLCKTYGHEHCSHFAYLTRVLRPPDDATWQFATLRDPDIQKIMGNFELARVLWRKTYNPMRAAIMARRLALKLKDSASVDTLPDNKEETIIAAVLALNTFMD